MYKTTKYLVNPKKTFFKIIYEIKNLVLKKTWKHVQVFFPVGTSW